MAGIADFIKDFMKNDCDIAAGSLSAASFWVGLRQEIYIGVMEKQPLRINLVSSLVDPDRSLSTADEYAWANLAVVHCADVLNLCFGPEQPPSSARWDELSSWNQAWQDKLPTVSYPVFFQPWSGIPGTFPQIWFYKSCSGKVAQVYRMGPQGSDLTSSHPSHWCPASHPCIAAPPLPRPKHAGGRRLTDDGGRRAKCERSDP